MPWGSYKGKLLVFIKKLESGQGKGAPPPSLSPPNPPLLSSLKPSCRSSLPLQRLPPFVALSGDSLLLDSVQADFYHMAFCYYLIRQPHSCSILPGLLEPLVIGPSLLDPCLHPYSHSASHSLLYHSLLCFLLGECAF